MSENTENTMDKKYVSFRRLSDFLNHLRVSFVGKEEMDGKADIVHPHTVSDITDFQSVLDEINTTIDTKTDAAGDNLGTVMSGGNVTIKNGIISVNDNGHNHTIDNIDELQNELNLRIDVETFNSHTHNDIYNTKDEVESKVSTINIAIDSIINGTTVVGEANHATNSDNATNAINAEKTMQDASGNIITDTYETKSDASDKLAEAKSYADGVKNDLLNGAGEAYDTLKELGDLIDENHDAIDALEIVAAGKADKVHSHDDLYYTESEIDNMEFITINDIDEICGASISVASLNEGVF